MTESTRRVLITGADGQLGREARRTAPAWAEVFAPEESDLDITSEDAVSRVVEDVEPDWILNAAGYTDVDGAEEDSERAFAVNAEGPAHLARAARAADCRLVHVSTDFVFDGATGRPYPPDAAPAPLSVYGESKLEGERRVREILGREALLVRTAWLYSATGHNFVHTMLRLLRERDEVRVVADQVGTPTWARGLADALWTMIERRLTGVHHWTHAGVASWYDFAVAIMEEAAAAGVTEGGSRATPTRVVPIPSKEYPTPAKRPGYSVLDTTETWTALGRTPPHWRVGLRRMLEELSGRPGTVDEAPE